MIKRFIEDVMVLYEQGIPIPKIADLLQIDRQLVENIVEEYSNFYS
jgi:hypothetical protein